MFRLLKALPLTLAIAALSIFAASCGSTSQSQVRVVHAIPDAPALDVNVNTTKVASAIAFDQVQPAPPAYTKVPSGSVTIAAFDTGTTTNPILNSSGVNLSGSTQHTMVLTGFNSSAVLLNITDNNAAPTSGNIEFRIIHASPSGTHPVDVYIVPPNTDITNVTPQISGLDYQQASSYQSLTFAANGYEVIVTPNGNKTGIVTQNYTPPTGSIRTLVLVDNPGGGNGMSTFPLELSDLN
jgi:hypothetical protein